MTSNRASTILMTLWLCGIAGIASAVPGQVTVTELGLLPGDAAVGLAVNSQVDLSAAPGGNQFLVAWSDYRGRSINSQTIQGDGDIYGIRVDASGTPIDPMPFLIAGGMGLQQRPMVAWNGQNWLVVFQSQEPVAGYYETLLRAVRVSPQGQPLDATPIQFAAPDFNESTIGLTVAGQAGQWLVTRCIYHPDTGYGTFLAGQRIDNNGQLLDAAPVMLNDWIYGQTRTIVSSGEYLVVGPDWNNSAITRARRIGLNGQPIGAAFTVPSLNIAANGSEYYVTWIANFTDLVGSRMTATGTLLNPAGTLLVPSFYGDQSLAHDGTNWWLAWSAASNARTLRISPAGAVLDPGGVPLPIVVTGTVNWLYSTKLAPVAGGGAVFFWVDLRAANGNDANGFALPLSAANVPGIEKSLTTATRNQRATAVAAGPAGGFAVAFVSEAANDGRVRVQRFDAAAAPLDTEPIEVAAAPTLGRCGIAWNGALYMIVWDQGASGVTPTQIKARRMNPDGSFVDAVPFDVMTGFAPDVGALGDDFLVVGAKFGYTPQYIDLYGRRYDGPTGTPLDASPFILATGYVSGATRVRSDGTQWLVGSHSMWSHDSSQGDALLVRVPPSGAPTPAINPTPYAGGTGDLDVAFSGAKYLLVWRNNSLSNANNYVAGRIMNADGSLTGSSFVIAEAPGRQLRPTVGWDGQSFMVVWEDQRNQQAFFDARTDLYAVRVSEEGALLDAAPFPVISNSPGEANAALLSRPNGVSYVASARFTNSPEFDSWRIGLTRLTAPVTLGDIDGNGFVDATDCNLFVQVLIGTDADPQHHARADLNGDGRSDGADVAPFAGVMMGG